MKYMGSKSRIAKHIVPIIQNYINENGIEKYVEPFVGGANVIDKVQCKEKYGFDKNKYLIALLKRDRVEKNYMRKFQRTYMTRQEQPLIMVTLPNLRIGRLVILALLRHSMVVGLMVDMLKLAMKRLRMVCD